VYNPYEFALCGGSVEERAGLAAALVAGPFAQYKVAVEQTDSSEVSEYPDGGAPLNTDMVLLLTEEDVEIPQIVLMDTDSPAIFTRALAYVAPRSACPILPADANFFTTEEVDALGSFLLKEIERRASDVPLYGLVLAGGKSTRMGRDKSALEYHGAPQVRHAYEQLTSRCDQVFVSSREEQAGEAHLEGLPLLFDAFLNAGPMAGILSAQRLHPNAAWLVLACDLPYVEAETLDYLLAQRNPLKLATAYTSAHDGFPEPLCAVYEPKSQLRLLHFLGLGYTCPRKVLINSDTNLRTLPSASSLDNINHPQEFESAKARLAGKQETHT
jgi:molybdopterin-guanine dinucleotide biosynthesis protein A